MSWGVNSSVFSLQRKRKGIAERNEVTLLCELFKGGEKEDCHWAWNWQRESKGGRKILFSE